MNYQITDCTSPKEIVRQVLNSKESQLLIPPQYSKGEIQISEFTSEKKSVGLFSSGTTAHPKCIWNSYENLRLNALQSARAFEISGENKLLILAKPWHVAGLSWALMAEELECEYEFITTKKGEGEKWLEAIQSLKPDFLLTVPPVFRAINDQDWFVQNIITGGIPLKKDDFSCLRDHCEIIIQGYGQTEAGGLISAYKHQVNKKTEVGLYQNCGKPIDGVHLQTKGSISEPAEIYIKSETAYVDGFYNSKDLGFIKNGNVYLSGRRK